MKKKTILIPDGEKLYSVHVVYCLKKACADLNIIACSDKFHSSFQYSKFVEKCYRMAPDPDPGHCLDRLVRIIRLERVDLLMPCTTDGIQFVLDHREALEAECAIAALPSRHTFDLVSDKWAMYETLAANRIPTPDTVLYRTPDQFKTAAYPLMLKPVTGESGVHIRKLEAMPDAACLEAIERTGETYILQEYIEGYDIDCSILASGGEVLAHTIQMNLGLKARFDPGNEKIRFIRENRVLETVKKTVELIGWTGVAHIDLRYDAARDLYQMIDFNPRFWGSILGSYSVGVNFPYLLYLLTFGISFETPEFKEKLFVSFRQFLKDLRGQSLKYSLGETNLRFLMADPVFSIRKLLRLK